MTMTTIKVPSELRDRIASDAQAHGMTAAAVVAQALDARDREQRWAAVGAAFAELATDDPYWAEFGEWESLGDPAANE